MGMFGTPKPMASLSSGLLARKGQARPAMRPQGFVGPETSIDDLGWNDLGEEQPGSVQPLTSEVETPVAAPPPPVLAERAALAREVAADTLAAIGRTSTTRKAKAAFTLRLDANRHLKLRLAGAIEGRSAQAIVTAALDRYLETLAEVEALAAQIRTGDGTR